MISQLHKYVDVDSPIATTLPIIFLGLSAAILILAALACCCTAKGKVPLLYLVSFKNSLDRVVGYQSYGGSVP